MAVLVYSRRSKKGEELVRILEVTSGAHVIERVAGVRALFDRIQRLSTRLEAAVLLLLSRKELDGILTFQETLFSIPTLIILPDRAEETVSKGHSLRPRYLTFLDGDFTEVAAVLGRVLEREERLRSKWSYPGSGFHSEETGRAGDPTAARHERSSDHT